MTGDGVEATGDGARAPSTPPPLATGLPILSNTEKGLLKLLYCILQKFDQNLFQKLIQ